MIDALRLYEHGQRLRNARRSDPWRTLSEHRTEDEARDEATRYRGLGARLRVEQRGARWLLRALPTTGPAGLLYR